jgi:Fe(3+) dicitrate transport protein
MKLKAFSVVVFLLVSSACFSQNRVSGIVLSSADSVAVNDCVIYLDNGKINALTDGKGRFVFEDVAEGKHILHFTTVEFEYQKHEFTVTGTNSFVRVKLNPRSKTLDEIVVSDVQTDFGFTRMRSVENMGIYEGKKTEVILPIQLIANTATNNARQVYSRVAGLNIWENDGAGIQLSIGGRGLDPNRSSNFNVRQNGHDISADALGYPESYYTPPIEGVGRIEIIRGAASLQYGTQFGGLVNFVMKSPVADKKLELTARQTAGSYGFYNAFTSASGTAGKVSYYTFFQYKRGDGWRKNSEFENHTFFGNINYRVNDKTKVGLDFSQMGYIAQQPGGLTDEMFAQNPRQSNRDRNWFKVNWNLLALHVDHQINSNSEFNLRVFGLNAYRYALGFRQSRVGIEDEGEERELITGRFNNIAGEARYLTRYNLKSVQSVLLLGARYYYGTNVNKLGVGSATEGPDFRFNDHENDVLNDYRFPNQNASLFFENIFHITDKFSVTPGARFEYINTHAEGYNVEVLKDLAGNEISRERQDENMTSVRKFVIAGVGVTYRPGKHLEIYSNISQNYKSISFNDFRFTGPSLIIDPELEDEKGYSFDLGIRSEQTVMFSYDISVFYLNYGNRIGEIDHKTDLQAGRVRTNIGKAQIYGIETYAEADVLGMVSDGEKWTGKIFTNIALIGSEYKSAKRTDINGNKVEFIPLVNLKTGFNVGYKKLKASMQYTFMSEQYSDASNSTSSDQTAVIGLIPEYKIVDVSGSYEFKRFRIEGSVNNLLNEMYYTRRATGYPGPGILPSDGRGFYITLQVKI